MQVRVAIDHDQAPTFEAAGGRYCPIRNVRSMETKAPTTILGRKAAEAERKARESEKLGAAAIVASAKLRDRFDAEREARDRRYREITDLG